LASGVADPPLLASSYVAVVAKASSLDHPGLHILGCVLGEGGKNLTRKNAPGKNGLVASRGEESGWPRRCSKRRGGTGGGGAGRGWTGDSSAGRGEEEV
jgi:hypothetical protein